MQGNTFLARGTGRGYTFCHLMLHFIKIVVLWIIDALPNISNLILVLVGVILSLPKTKAAGPFVPT